MRSVAHRTTRPPAPARPAGAPAGRGGPRLLLVAAALLPCLACAQILGLEDRVLDPRTDAAGDAAAGDARATDAPANGDAPSGGDAQGTCPGECTSCLDGVCQIDCGAGECTDGVTCPPGLPCRVNCVGSQACEKGVVDCSEAAQCDIVCDGTDACDYGVICGGTQCSVRCTGSAACEDKGVLCNAASCSIVCDGDRTCYHQVCCNGGDCGEACAPLNGGCCACGGC